MREMEKLLGGVASELCTNLFAAEVGSDLEAEITRETLKRRLLPLLEAGGELRKSSRIEFESQAWDAALAAARQPL